MSDASDFFNREYDAWEKASAARKGKAIYGTRLTPDEKTVTAPMPDPDPVSDKTIFPAHDPVNHPAHYTSSKSGIECIDVVEHLSFNIGNAIKYLWRAGKKGDALEDLRKSRWYVDREIARLEKK